MEGAIKKKYKITECNPMSSLDPFILGEKTVVGN